MTHRNLNVLEASENASHRITEPIERPARRQLIHTTQSRRAAQAVPANSSEGFGRGTAGDRTRALRIARGEAEETTKHLRSNFHAQRIVAREYWTLHNLMVVIVKMLDSLINR